MNLGKVFVVVCRGRPVHVGDVSLGRGPVVIVVLQERLGFHPVVLDREVVSFCCLDGNVEDAL
eukprot:12042383-Heterocapsa_arctica.AAC.1